LRARGARPKLASRENRTNQGEGVFVRGLLTRTASRENRLRYDGSASDESLRDYIWMGGIPIANVDTTGGTSTIAYVTADQLGTPRAIANSSGTTEWQNPYQGNPWNEVSPTSTGYTYNLGLPGQYYDSETGLSNNVHRDYDPSTGRFVQSDPVGLAAGPSTYAALNNNPLKYTDPTGLDAILLINPGGAQIGGSNAYGGHAAVIVGNDQDGWIYYSEDGLDAAGGQQTTSQYYSTLNDFENAMGQGYMNQEGVTTSEAQDDAMYQWAEQHLEDQYSVWTNNCGDYAKGVLQAGGIPVNSNWFGPTIPNDMSIAAPTYVPNNPSLPNFYLNGQINQWYPTPGEYSQHTISGW
jgi:RHS repeat-associated protein